VALYPIESPYDNKESKEETVLKYAPLLFHLKGKSPIEQTRLQMPLDI